MAIMDDVFEKLQSRPPRAIRRRKNRRYDNWDGVNVSFKLLLASNLCLVIGWLSFPLGLVLLIFGGLLSPFSVSFAFAALSEMRKHKFLVRYGQATIGEIKWRKEHSLPEFGCYYTVDYEFATDKGEIIKGKWKEAAKPFWESKRGDKFIVLYKQNRPGYHIAYESALYEPE